MAISSQQELKALVEALKGGVGIETAGQSFYRKAASEVDDEFLAKTLEFLANEEKKHEAYLEAFIESFRIEQEAPTNMRFQSGIIGKVPKLFPEMEAYKKSLANAAPNRKNPKLDLICEEALRLEDKSIAFYEASKEKAPSWGSTRIFNALIAEEKKHKQIIEMQRDYGDVHGFFFDLGEEKHFALD